MGEGTGTGVHQARVSPVFLFLLSEAAVSWASLWGLLPSAGRSRPSSTLVSPGR